MAAAPPPSSLKSSKLPWELWAVKSCSSASASAGEGCCLARRSARRISVCFATRLRLKRALLRAKAHQLE
eukprot:1378078-Alexandrium_andersonii.AAC.1